MTVQQFRDILDAPEPKARLSARTILVWWNDWLWPVNKVLLFYAMGIAISYLLIRMLQTIS